VKTIPIKKAKTMVHFADNYLINPTNPVTVNLIGVGGTGSQVLTGLARMHQSLLSLGHAGLLVRVYDDDRVTAANLGRQLFAEAELGFLKADALINRINRFFGTGWKAMPYRFCEAEADKIQPAQITLSCVDTVQARFEIAAMLQQAAKANKYMRDKPLYWMDFGNSRFTGQVVLATLNKIPQPASKKYLPCAELLLITDEYHSLLQTAKEDNTPSCSLAEALSKQDLFINSVLANMGCSLLWQLFREGMVRHRGFFLNIGDFPAQPIAV
jgi:PRTRC genetic system ThiF family protein